MMFALPIVSGKYPDEAARVYHHHTKQSIRLKPARKTLFPKPGGLMGESAAEFISLFIVNHFQTAPFLKGFFNFWRRIFFNRSTPERPAFCREVKVWAEDRL